MGRARRRTVAAIVLIAGFAAGPVGCADDDREHHTIGILRAVAGSTNELRLLGALDAAGYSSGELTILGRRTDEVHVDAADIERTVRMWVGKGVDLIFAISTTGALTAARVAPDEVPVLFISTDPTATGLVADERHPESHLTGMSYRVPADRTLAIADDAFGPLHRLGCVFPSDDPAAGPGIRDLERGAGALGMELACESFADPAHAGAAVAAVVATGVDAVVLVNAPSLVRAFPELAAALGDVRLPVIANAPTEFATLILQPDAADVYEQLGRQAARLLDGAAVADVPVQDPGHFLLIVNQASATRIGRTVPPDLVRRADRVIR